MKQSPSNTQKDKGAPQALIGEMMLAKTVLEEKSEHLEQKDRTIRELRTQHGRLEAELEELKSELERIETERTTLREEAVEEGMRRVIAEVVTLASEYEAGVQALDRSLASRLIYLFQERYGLEVIAGTPTRVDPERHRVIEVVEAPEGVGYSSIRVLARGFRLEGKTIKSALVKVIKGMSGGSAASGAGDLEEDPWRVA